MTDKRVRGKTGAYLPVEKIFVEITGDPSVGIDSSMITIEGDFIFDPTGDDDPEIWIEDCRKRLQDCFSMITGDKVNIFFDGDEF